MDTSDAPPRKLSGRYELSHLVARGGMAEVYLAHDQLLDRPVALKILFPELSVDRSFVERFRREAQAAANLSHPNIVPVFDWGEDGGTYFIVMEYVDGRTLSSILRSAGPLHPDRAAEIGADVAGALSYAHRHGVVHRDVKPGNVLITEEGTVKVTDFGIARAVNTEESLTQTGAVMGTATYFSPEQAEGLGVDARSDVYSLGVVLFEMVTGRPPFLGETPVAVASKHVREHPPMPRDINPAIPPTLEAVIMKCMAKSAEHRYQTADELRSDLVRFREGRGVNAGIPPTAMQQAVGATSAMPAVGRTQSMRAVTGPVAYQEEQRSRTGLYVALLVLLLVALAVVLLFLGNSLGWWHLGTSNNVTMPDLTGKSLTRAESTLRSDGLKYTVTADPNSTQPNTIVIRTNPGAGTTVQKGQNVILVTGNAGNKVPVPDVTNQSVQRATSQLQGLGFQVQVQQQPTCNQINVVCSQDPAGGTRVNQGSTVSLITAQQQTTTTISGTPVPDVAGDTVPQACNALGLSGFKCGSTTFQPSTAFQSGIVSATSPAAGSNQAPGTTVNLIVSSGPPNTTTTTATATVPDETGQLATTAYTDLQAHGFKPSPANNCSPVGARVQNEPDANTTQPVGATINYTC
ncbi:MAG: Stk1 family PASTA domain-containing Ser/Thr kinase [Acidobacteriota bacterium]|nr:Stk1 family PASTA domain-containing Ser/Thr kinase [Acidobacteriota bacterium]